MFNTTLLVSRYIYICERISLGPSLAVQWLELHAFTTGSYVPSLVRELRSGQAKKVVQPPPPRPCQKNTLQETFALVEWSGLEGCTGKLSYQGRCIDRLDHGPSQSHVRTKWSPGRESQWLTESAPAWGFWAFRHPQIYVSIPQSKIPGSFELLTFFLVFRNTR